MSKEYFPHDYGARLSLRGIRKDFGMSGVGFYWCFVEILHEEGGYIKECDLDNIAYDLQVEPELCYAVTHNYDLFVVKKGKIFSERVLRNIKKREEISAARKRAANGRWGSASPQEEPEAEPESEPPPEPVDEEVIEEEEENFKSGVEFYTDQVKMRCDMWYDELKQEGRSVLDLFQSPPEIIKPRLINLFELIKSKKVQKIGGQTVDTLDVMKTIVDFFRGGDEKRWDLYNLITEVDLKAANGEIKNKQNYLMTALYNAAKLNGA